MFGCICLSILIVGAVLASMRHSPNESHPKLRQFPISLVSPQQNESLGAASSTYDHRKVAVIVEKRHLPTLVPVLHTFLTLVPPEWPFELWTSQETGHSIASSQRIKPYIDSGKLQIKLLPDNGSHIYDGPTLSAFLTTPYLWQRLSPAEHIFFFQADSLLCSKSTFELNDFLGLNDTRTSGEGYAWVGAPWDLRGYPAEPWGGNGGLSIRRRSVMLNITSKYEWDGSAEDVWFTKLINLEANGTSLFPEQSLAMRFSYESLPGAAQHLDWASASLR